MNLLEKMKKAGSITGIQTLAESSLFNMRDTIPTDIPIINMAFSGYLDGGISTGLTVFSGESKTFKTMLSLYCLKAYQDKYPESVCLFYDCEFGVTPEYLTSFGLDVDRILHIPVEHVEELKFDIVKRMEDVKRGDRVFVLLDSLGNLASKKEVDDALDAKSVADMSRAKAIRSLLRITTPHLTAKDIPFIMVNHVYKTQELYSKDVIPGGTAVTYSANTIFVISKAQEKTGTDVTGYKFTLNINKSRFVKEKSKFPFVVDMDTGIKKYSGLLEVALESGHVVKPSNGWYSRAFLDESTGEMVVEEEKHRAKDTNEDSFWLDIMNKKDFKDFISDRYRYGSIRQKDDDWLDPHTGELVE